jgi:hypothetical protein
VCSSDLKGGNSIDDWCGEELLNMVSVLKSKLHFDVCIVNYVWMSGVLRLFNHDVMKIVNTIDRFANREPTWFSTTESEEKKGLQRADYVISIQEEEQSYFSSLVGAKNVFRLSMQSATPRYLPEKNSSSQLRIGYVANNNLDNANAMNSFLKAWKRNSRLRKSTIIAIAGHICDAIDSEYRECVELLGVVEDLEGFYRSCDLIINPDFGGSGLKIKNLEAVSFGKPILSTRRSMVGIQAESLSHLCESLSEMMTRLLHICRNREELSLLRESSIELHEKYRNASSNQMLIDSIVNWKDRNSREGSGRGFSEAFQARQTN